MVMDFMGDEGRAKIKEAKEKADALEAELTKAKRAGIDVSAIEQKARATKARIDLLYKVYIEEE